jgi:hypothetical protein
MAETDQWVAMASEYRAIAVLPGAQDALTWEPEPGRVYSWGTAPVATPAAAPIAASVPVGVPAAPA